MIMKTNSPWFTLIELLIVITIIAFIGITSLSGLSRMVEVQDSETTISIITHTLDWFDRTIANHEITSYEVIFESGSLGFVTSFNKYKKITSVECYFNFSTGTGFLKSTHMGTGVWEINFSTYNTPWQTLTLLASGGLQSFTFPSSSQKRWQNISSMIGDEAMNSCEIQYYTLTNRENTPEKETYLVNIIGGNNISYQSLIVRNILGKKVLQGSGTSIDSIEKATLFFEKNGKTVQMNLSL